MFCNWDAEEYGLVGSTEWIEVCIADISDSSLILCTEKPPGGGVTPILDLKGCTAQQGVLLR